MRPLNIIYTYYRLDFEGFNYNDGDYTICETLDEVREVLQGCDIDLDTPSEIGEPEKRIIITGIGMTPAQFNQYQWSLDPENQL